MLNTSNSGQRSPQSSPPLFNVSEPHTLPIWNNRHERILKEWAEESMCFQRMHEDSHRKFTRLNLYFTLPVIIFSTLSGTANFSLASFSHQWQTTIPILTGSVNIISGIITTVAQYLHLSERSEGHRVAALAYGKMARTVASELKLPRLERSSSGLPLLRLCRNELERLEEQSPDIPCEVIRKFFKAYGSLEITRPSSMDIQPVFVYPERSDRNELISHAFAQLKMNTKEAEEKEVGTTQ